VAQGLYESGSDRCVHRRARGGIGKQNLVLSEDLGKTQLKARQLEDVAKQQAEAIAKLNQQVAEQQAQMQAEKEKQAKKNKQMWIAVGVLFLGIIASN